MPGPPHLSPFVTPPDELPATTEALVALIASKADDGQYHLQVTQPTTSRFSGYAPTGPAWGQPYFPPELTFPVHDSAAVRPATAATAVLYQWRLHYRGRRQGGRLAADAACDQVARAMCARQALGWMNAVDVRYPVNPTPNPVPDVAGMALDPRGRIRGSLLGYAGPKTRGNDR